MISYMIISVTVIILFCTTLFAAETKPEPVVTQKDFARMILQQYSWGDDYLKLSGIKGPADRIILPDEAKTVLKGITDRYPVNI